MNHEGKNTKQFLFIQPQNKKKEIRIVINPS